MLSVWCRDVGLARKLGAQRIEYDAGGYPVASPVAATFLMAVGEVPAHNGWHHWPMIDGALDLTGYTKPKERDDAA